jgi:hypothetical protein
MAIVIAILALQTVLSTGISNSGVLVCSWFGVVASSCRCPGESEKTVRDHSSQKLHPYPHLSTVLVLTSFEQEPKYKI